MPTREELYERLKQLQRGKVKPQFYRLVAEEWGYVYEKTTGSHMQFKKPGHPRLTATIVGGQRMHLAAIKDLISRIEKERKVGE
jgi:predicted RNA binding protein YcfA (HicA-like mRNA interferase family)